MNQPIKRYMKPGLIHFMAYPTAKDDNDLLNQIKSIANDTYFDAIEITHIENKTTAAQAAELLDTSGMAIAYGAQPRLLKAGLNPNDLCEEGRIAALELLKSSADEAAAMGASGIAFLSGKYQQETIEQSYQQLVKTTCELCEYAKGLGLNVALEVFDYDMDKCSLIGPVELAERYAKEVTSRCSNFGLMVDLSHLPLLHVKKAAEAIVPVRDYICHAHLGNAVICRESPAFGDLHPRFGFPDSANGVPEMVDYLRVLMDIGFLSPERRPIVSFEVKPFGDEDPEMVIANAKRTLDAAWALL